MSGAWPRNYQGPSSFRPGASAGAPTTTPDVSVRNHKKWRAGFEKLLADYLVRGHSGVEDLARYTRRAINGVLDSQPTAESFKAFQVISDIIDALAHERNNLPGPIAYAKAECSRRDLINLTNLGPGRLYVRGIYRLFPIDHKGFDNDKEFDVFLIRRGISLWPVTINPTDNNNNNNRRAIGPTPRADIVIPVKRQLESSGSGGGFGGLGASHYSPPPRPRPMPPRRWGQSEDDTMSINEMLNTSGGGSGVPVSAPAGPAASIPTATPIHFPSGILGESAQSSSSTKGGLLTEKDATSSALVPSSASSERHTATQENETEKMEKMFDHFTKSIAEQQKENLTLSSRVSELEASLKKAEDELTTLKQGADADQVAKFVEEKKTLVREQNKFALDKARFTAQVSTWVEKLGQVQQGLSAHLPRNLKMEDLKEGELI